MRVCISNRENLCDCTDIYRIMTEDGGFATQSLRTPPLRLQDAVPDSDRGRRHLAVRRLDRLAFAVAAGEAKNDRLVWFWRCSACPLLKCAMAGREFCIHARGRSRRQAFARSVGRFGPGASEDAPPEPFGCRIIFAPAAGSSLAGLKP